LVEAAFAGLYVFAIRGKDGVGALAQQLGGVCERALDELVREQRQRGGRLTRLAFELLAHLRHSTGIPSPRSSSRASPSSPRTRNAFAIHHGARLLRKPASAMRASSSAAPPRAASHFARSRWDVARASVAFPGSADD